MAEPNMNFLSPSSVLRAVLLSASLWAMAVGARAQDAQFTNVIRLTNREIALRFIAPAGNTYRIDASTNLSVSNELRWNSLLTLQSAGVNQHTDSAAPYVNSRFYRAEQLTNANVLTGDNLVTTNGDAVIHPVGHASFVMSWNGKMIYNDPTPQTAFGSFAKADLILISHDHGDHYDTNAIKAVRAANGIIVLPPGVYNNARFTSFRSNAVPLGYGQSTNLMGVQIEAVPAHNATYHPYGTNNAYVITLADKRIFTSGDCGDGMEIRAVTNIDVAFLCMNLPFTMNASSATNVIRAMRPRVVYPYHYREGSIVTNAAAFKQWLGSDLGIEVRLRKWY
jgi:L-ascorbate metabolism protein UlaG (beta-lactamase superfamily)